ncbi:MAG: hypothetical protein F6K47_15725 [Symploca sp. SIO2E6]|nr:hypothetical protein [Symploca sp. SIO2E6]
MGIGNWELGIVSYIQLSLACTHYSLLITHYSLLITHYSLLITHYLLLMSTHPLVSIAINNYNYGRFLPPTGPEM